MFADIFDTTGTLIAVAEKCGLMRNNKIRNFDKAMLVDSGSTVVGSLLGTSTSTAFIESNAGIVVGGKTGLTAVFTGLLFLITLFFAPLVGSIPVYATAPALIFVAILLIGVLGHFNEWDDITESVPMIMTAIIIPLSFSIADGIAVGIILYTLINFIGAKTEKISAMMAGLTIICAAQFIFL